MNLNDVKHRCIEIARSYGHKYVIFNHLMLFLTEDDETSAILELFHVPVEELRKLTLEELDKCESFELDTAPAFSLDMKRTFSTCLEIRGSAVGVSLADVVAAAIEHVRTDEDIAKEDYPITKLVDDIDALSLGLMQMVNGGQAGIEKDESTETSDAANSFTDGSKSAEKMFSTLHANNDELVSHKNSVSLILHALGQTTDSLCVIVGEDFSGKSSVIQEVINRATDDDLELPISGLKFIGMNINRALLSGSYDNSRAINSAIKVAEREGSVLVIDDLHSLLSNAFESNVGTILLRAARNGVKIICSTDPSGYSKVFESLPSSENVSKVVLKEPTADEITQLITREIDEQTIVFGMSYDESLPNTCVSITRDHFHGNLLANTFRVLNRATSIAVSSRGSSITKEHLEKAVCEIKGISRDDLDLTTNQIVMGLAERLKKNVYGQDESIDKISRIVRTSKMGFKENEARPNASIMMLGSTGTGKTETATQMAKELGVELIRLDMSEYQESHTVSKLLGAPAGYAGYNDGDGFLYDRLSKNPDAIVLFDEIEKAHPNIYRLLLGAMDHGIMTTSTNKKIVFKDTFLIFTSNIGVESSQNGNFGLASDGKSNEVSISLPAYKNFFSAEFRNRIDLLLTFNTLNEEVAIKVVDKVAKRVADALKRSQGMELILEKPASKLLVKNHFSLTDGARTISRGFQTDISNLVIDKLIENEQDKKSSQGNPKKVIIGTAEVDGKEDYTVTFLN